MGWPARIGWGLLAALAIALGVAWFLHTHERVEDTVPLPPRGEAWVIFDNTAHGHATPNASDFQDLVRA